MTPTRSLTTLLAALALATGSATVAHAAPAADTQGPSLKALVPAYVLGSQVMDDSYVSAAEMMLKWQAADPSGICGYRYGYDDAYDRYWNSARVNSRATSGAYHTFQDDIQGSGQPRDYVVRVFDCAGNHTDLYFGAQTFDFEDLGDTPPAGWSTFRCLCATRGTMLRSETKGASVIRRNVDGNHFFAVVAAVGPARGAFSITVDGHVVGTYDTFADTNDNRVVVAQRFLGPGTHTVKITNVGTAGRSRVDLDAFLH